jgi:Leucine-rich repeat (LRR) protein
LENLPVEFGKLQSLVEVSLLNCSQLGCLPSSIVHLSELETFKLRECQNLENLPMEFSKLQSLMDLDTFDSSESGFRVYTFDFTRFN